MIIHRHRRHFTLGVAAAIISVLAFRGTGELLAYRTVQDVIVRPIPKQTPVPQTFPPNRIVIPAIGLDLPVTPAVVEANDWELFDDAASWLAKSAKPGEGNVIIYAHNRNALFMPITETRFSENFMN
jgi:hypothetical protein